MAKDRKRPAKPVVDGGRAAFEVDGQGRTALFRAAAAGDVAEVRRIVFGLPGTGVMPQRLALLTRTDADGRTASEAAEAAGHTQIAAFLRHEQLRMEFFE